MPAPVRASLGIQKHCFFIVFCFSSEPDRRPARGILVCLAQDTPLVVSRWKRCGTSLLFFFFAKIIPATFFVLEDTPATFFVFGFFTIIFFSPNYFK